MNDEFIISCGGSIISPRTVLTSAHCLIPSADSYIFAGLQSINLKLPILPSSSSEGQIIKVTKTKLHEKFRTESEHDYDVALASFDDELAFRENVSLNKLTMYWARLDDPVYTFGWERSTAENQSKNLRWTQTHMVCRSTGLKDLAQPGAWDHLDIFTDGVLFVKDLALDESMCYGSAGSPVVVGDLQIGITSFGIDYACQGLNAITSIRRQLRWIEKNKLVLEEKKGTKSRDMPMITSTMRRRKEILLGNKAFISRKTSATISMQSRIRNGTRIVSPETFPFFVGIAYDVSPDPAKFPLPRCGGSILTQWIVITAAHCIKSDHSYRVYAGIVDHSLFTTEGATYQAISVLTFRRHEKYDPKIRDYDIVLLLLSEPLRINAGVTPVCQPALKAPISGTSLYIAGWGRREDGYMPSFPSFGNVTVVDHLSGKIVNLTGIFLMDTTDTKGSSGCPGDSGSPYFNEHHEIVGIDKAGLHLYGGGKCYNEGSIAVSVGWFLDWIMKTIDELEAQVL